MRPSIQWDTHLHTMDQSYNDINASFSTNNDTSF